MILRRFQHVTVTKLSNSLTSPEPSRTSVQNHFYFQYVVLVILPLPPEKKQQTHVYYHRFLNKTFFFHVFSVFCCIPGNSYIPACRASMWLLHIGRWWTQWPKQSKAASTCTEFGTFRRLRGWFSPSGFWEEIFSNLAIFD